MKHSAALFVLLLTGALTLIQDVPGSGAPDAVGMVCATYTPERQTVSPVPTKKPGTVEPLPSRLPSYGAFVLGDEGPDVYQRMVQTGLDWAAIRVVCDEPAGCIDWAASAVAAAHDAGLQTLVIAWIGEDGVSAGDCGTSQPLTALAMLGRELAGDAVAYGWEPGGCAVPEDWAVTARSFYQGVDGRVPVVLGIAAEYWTGGPYDRDWLPRLLAALDGRRAFDVLGFSGWDDFRATWRGVDGKAASMRAGLEAWDVSADVAMIGGGLPSGPSDQWTRRSLHLQAEGIRRIAVECARADIRWCMFYRARDGDDWARFGILGKPAGEMLASTLAALRRGEDVAVVPGRERMGKR